MYSRPHNYQWERQDSTLLYLTPQPQPFLWAKPLLTVKYPQQTFWILRQVYHHTFADFSLPLAPTLATAPGTSISQHTAAIIYDLEICSLRLVYRNCFEQKQKELFSRMFQDSLILLIQRSSVFYRRCGERGHTEERPFPGQWPCLFCRSLTFIPNLINVSSFFMIT